MKLISLEIRHLIPAPAPQVFDVWLDPARPGGPWFGAERLIHHPVVDGLFYLQVSHEGRSWPHYGRYLKIERPRLVEYTWVSEATLGLESVVSLAFEPRSEATEVVLRHTGLPDNAEGRKHEQGWGFILGTLAQGLGPK